MPDAQIRIEGTIAGDVRYNQSGGRDVANVRILAGRSRKNDDGTWENLSTTAYDIAYWGEHAHLVHSLNPQKGDKAIATGTITKLEAYNGQNGESLSAKVSGDGIKVFPKQQSGGFGGNQQSGGYQQNQQQGGGWGQNPQAQADPWANSNAGAGDAPF